MTSEEARPVGASRLSIVMPVYNERGTLREALRAVLQVDFPIPAEVLLVDDGSTDGSLDTVGDLIDGTTVRMFRQPRNQGKGAAVRRGVREATGDVLTAFDADLEYDPSDLVSLLQPILAGETRVVYGTRAFSSDTAFSFWYVLGNRLVSLWASMLFNTWLSDIETCFKLAPVDLWREVGLSSSGFGIEAEVTGRFLRRGERIFEKSVSYRARDRAAGKKLTWTDGVAALWILLRTRLAPVR